MDLSKLNHEERNNFERFLTSIRWKRQFKHLQLKTEKRKKKPGPDGFGTAL